MSGSAVNQGRVRFEYLPDIEDVNIRWRARMRNHTGMGETAEAAAANLVADVEKELRAAKAGQASLRPKGGPG